MSSQGRAIQESGAGGERRTTSRTEILLALAIFGLALVPVAVPYAQPGHQVAHDRLVPYMRVDALYQALRQGQIPPRWFTDFDGGYGSPYPSFYAMLFYYPATALFAAGLPLGSSVELIAFAVLALSGVAMFAFVARYWGIPSGLLAAILYVYSPYHLTDAFERGAYSELAAFVWPPLIALSYLACFEERGRRWVLFGGLCTAGMMLTHNLTALMFFLPVFLLLVARSVGRRLRLHQVTSGMRRVAMAVALGLALSAFLWLPVLLERQFVHLDRFLRFDFRGDFVPLRWLIWLPENPHLDTSVGLALAVLSAAALVLAIARKVPRMQAGLLTGLLGLGWFNLFMTTRYSSFVWKWIAPLQYVQFPWRFLLPASFYLAAAAGSFVQLPRRARTAWIAAVSLGLIVVLSYANLVRIPDRRPVPSIEPAERCSEVWLTQDYRPRWSQAAFWSGPQPPSDPQLGLVLPTCPENLVLDAPGTVEVLSEERAGPHWIVQMRASVASAVTLSQFYYPGWEASIDGSPATVSPTQPEGLMNLVIPQGVHTIEIRYSETPIRRAANLLVLIGVGAGLWLLFGERLGRLWPLRIAPSLPERKQ